MLTQTSSVVALLLGHSLYRFIFISVDARLPVVSVLTPPQSFPSNQFPSTKCMSKPVTYDKSCMARKKHAKVDEWSRAVRSLIIFIRSLARKIPAIFVSHRAVYPQGSVNCPVEFIVFRNSLSHFLFKGLTPTPVLS